MRRMTLAWVLVLGLAATTAHAREARISVFGGASLPTGDFASESVVNAQTGWQIGGSYDVDWNETWALGVDGGWSQNAHGTQGSSVDMGGGNVYTVDHDQFSTWQLGLHTRYHFPMAATMPVRWHASAGAALYGMTEDYRWTSSTGSTVEGSIADKRAGLNFGLGGTWWANAKFGVIGGLDYHIAFMDKDTSPASTLSYAGLNLGMTFKLPTAGQ